MNTETIDTYLHNLILISGVLFFIAVPVLLHCILYELKSYHKWIKAEDTIDEIGS